MRKVKAVTHHHPKFLKAAHKLDSFVDLVNTPDQVKKGDRYISFDPSAQHFCVYTQADRPRLVGKYDSILSAIFYANK